MDHMSTSHVAMWTRLRERVNVALHASWQHTTCHLLRSFSRTLRYFNRTTGVTNSWVWLLLFCRNIYFAAQICLKPDPTWSADQRVGGRVINDSL